MTQCERILKYIEDFGSISTMQAFHDLGITRLASRVHELKRNGHDIKSEIVCGKNRNGEPMHYSVYSKAV